MKFKHQKRLTVPTAVLSVIFMGFWAGISSAASPPMTRLTVERGEIFEIISAEAAMGSAQSAWVLSKDGVFAEAKRSAIFRTRFLEAGSYRLDSESRNISGEVTDRTVINISVPDKASETNNGSDADSNSLVTITPPLDAKGRLVLNPENRIITLTPPSSAVGLYADFDALTDTDRDGNPSNDSDAEDTFFSSQGTTLHVMLSMDEPRNITVSDGKVFQIIRAVDRITAQKEDEAERKRIEIKTEDKGGGKFAFRIEYLIAKPSVPVLTKWNFGDGEESLLDAPVHKYSQTGSFTALAQIYDISAGTKIEETSTVIFVTESEAQPPQVETPKNEKGKGQLLAGILKITLAVFAALAAGLSIAFIVSRIKKGASLPEKLEQAEKKIVGEKPNADFAENKEENPVTLELPDDKTEIVSFKTQEPPSAPAKNSQSGGAIVFEAMDTQEQSAEADGEEEEISEEAFRPGISGNETGPDELTSKKGSPLPPWLRPSSPAAKSAPSQKQVSSPAEQVPARPKFAIANEGGSSPAKQVPARPKSAAADEGGSSPAVANASQQHPSSGAVTRPYQEHPSSGAGKEAKEPKENPSQKPSAEIPNNAKNNSDQAKKPKTAPPPESPKIPEQNGPQGPVPQWLKKSTQPQSNGAQSNNNHETKDKKPPDAH